MEASFVEASDFSTTPQNPSGTGTSSPCTVLPRNAARRRSFRDLREADCNEAPGCVEGALRTRKNVDIGACPV